MSTDQELVKDFLSSRSDAAFRKLYREKPPHLYQMALRLTSHNTFEADELIQTMWITAIRKLDGFQWKSSLKTWLTGILINLNRDELRKVTTQQKLSEQLETVSRQRPATHSGYDIETALSRIALGYRKVIILHDLEGYQHKEIAALLNINEGTSKSQLFQARKALREQLTSQDK